jgi:cytidylate kinase
VSPASAGHGLTIAIDGVIGAGKSTVARAVAAALGYRHLDTGAMYRAVALTASARGITPGDAQALETLLDDFDLELEPASDEAGPQGGRILVDNEDVSEQIRTPEVSRVVGSYADIPAVRRAMVRRQQAFGAAGGVVAEGRDMTSVVFPDADLKVFMIADLDERAARRHREFTDRGVDISLEQVRADIEQRDREDAQRDYGSGETADASAPVEVDTTGLGIDEVVQRIISLARQRGG